MSVLILYLLYVDTIEEGVDKQEPVYLGASFLATYLLVCLFVSVLMDVMQI